MNEKIIICTVDHDGCWLWQGARTKVGYPVTRRSNPRRKQLLTRVVLEFKLNRPLRPSMLALHKCDKRLIVNIVMAVITADFRSTKIAIFPFRTRRTTASTISHVCDLHILHVTCHASSVSAGASWPSWFWPLASNSRNVCQGSQVYNSQNMEASQC
jgi:hypothetical protein